MPEPTDRSGTTGQRPAAAPYDKRKLSYATSFSNPWKAGTIRALEWMTGKMALLRMVRAFERQGPAEGQAFFAQALDTMGIAVETPPDQIARIPKEGPLVVVANHPHGLVDGMVLCELIGRVRQDYRILTRSLLTGVSEIEAFMIPVPFPDEAGAREQSLAMRAAAMEVLASGGAIALFPAGGVAASQRAFGPAIEGDWAPFTARMIQRSGAQVVPVRFTGQNSRAYQIANRISATLRQGLLIHEVMKACNSPQAPFIGSPIPPEALSHWGGRGREMMNWLRAHTLALDGDQRVGTGVSPR